MASRNPLLRNGAATFGIVVEGADAMVSAGPFEDRNEPCDGDVVAVTDALSGREPALASVLDAPTDLVDALSCVGAFLRG